jgi:hypothetical protein
LRIYENFEHIQTQLQNYLLCQFQLERETAVDELKDSLRTGDGEQVKQHLSAYVCLSVCLSV